VPQARAVACGLGLLQLQQGSSQPVRHLDVEPRRMGERCLIMTRILIVEDENFLAMELMWIVEDAGYSVVGRERSVAETRQVPG
jgi:hypothetical protein